MRPLIVFPHAGYIDVNHHPYSNFLDKKYRYRIPNQNSYVWNSVHAQRKDATTNNVLKTRTNV